MTDANTRESAAAVTTAERAASTLPGVSTSTFPGVEDGLAALRRAVRMRKPNVSTDAEALYRRIAELSIEVEILEVLDSYRDDQDGTQPRLIALADRLLDRIPPDADAARDLSMLLLYADRRESAERTARAVLTAHPGDIGLLLVVLATVFPGGGSAVTDIVRDIFRAPVPDAALLAELDQSWLSADILCRLADNAISLGRTALALDIADRVLAADPANDFMRSIRLRCFILLDRPERALEDANAILAREPSHIVGRLGRAEALVRLEHTDEAIAALDEAAEAIADMGNLVAPLDATRHGELDSVAANVGALQIEVLARANRISDALALGDQVAAEHPGDPTIAIIRARVLQAAGDWDKALAVTVEARDFDQENAELRNAQAAILMNLGRLEDALGVLGQSATLDPLDADGQLLRAEILDRMGHTDDAIAALDEIAARDPGNVKVSERRSALLLSAHRYVEALDTIELARAAGKETSGLLILRAQALLSLERYEEAFSCFKSVLDTPGTGEDLAGKVEAAAQTLFFANRVSQALTLLERLDDRHGLSAAGQYLIAELFRMADAPDKSLAHADIALASTQDMESRAQTLATKSMALISLARSAEALEAVDEALAAFDGYLFGWAARSMALNGIERPTEALQLLDQRLASAPDDWQEWLLPYRASCLTAVGQHDEAIAVMRPRFDDFAAVGAVGDGPTLIRSNLGYVYIRQRRYTDALEMLEPARRGSPDEWNPWALNNLIVALMVESRGDSDEVQPIAERELKLATAVPAAPDRRAVAAWSQFWLRRYDDALASVDAVQAMRKDPLLQIRMAMGLLMIGMGHIERGEAEIRQVLNEASQLSDQLRGAEIRAYGQWVSGFLIEGRRLAQVPDALGNAGTTIRSGG